MSFAGAYRDKLSFRGAADAASEIRDNTQTPAFTRLFFEQSSVSAR